MAKLTLTVAPTFLAKVAIPVPGAKAVPVEFKFKARTKDEFKEFVKGLGESEDVDAIMEMAMGWELDDAFNKDNVDKMVQNYIGSARAILDKYLTENSGARLGN